MSLGLSLCNGMYKVTAGIKYQEDFKTLKKYIDLSSLIPNINEVSPKTVFSFEIFDDDTYIIKVGNDEVTETKGSIVRDFGIEEPEYFEIENNLLPQDYNISKIEQILFSNDDIYTPEMQNYLKDWDDFLDQ